MLINIVIHTSKQILVTSNSGHCGRDCIVIEFTTTYAISSYHQ